MRQLLKVRTAHLHAALDEAIAIDSLLRDAPDPSAAYRRLLQQLMPAVAAQEVAMAVFAFDLEAMGLAPARRLVKRHWLARDLTAAGSLTVDVPQRISINDVFEAIGHLYVAEGATMGGRHVVRLMERHRASLGHLPNAYFSAYASATGTMWREFIGVLETMTPSAQERERVVEGACRAFDLYLGQFERRYDRAS
ncbi:biliverdin-producing heme oxygenase [Ectothiorhodospiraceae bacterium WFHF3C12]|nr:biliverdin-producing heme oxygenase [Ectothiorhodospiraceae bacterium WFHF3C12]